MMPSICQAGNLLSDVLFKYVYLLLVFICQGHYEQLSLLTSMNSSLHSKFFNLIGIY